MANLNCTLSALAFVASAALGSTQAARAQTNDETRLSLGISGGFVGSISLWDVPAQPIVSTFDGTDIFHLRRESRSDISLSGHVTFYPHPHVGFTGEFTYLGLGNNDACTLVHDTGDLDLQAACASLKGTNGSASVTQVQAGMVVRPLTRSFFQPYLKVMGGLAFTPTSTIAMRADYGQIGDTALLLTIYKDDHWTELRPSWTAALGITTAANSGYQLHVEVREAWMPLGIVTGPTSGQGFVPPNKTALKAFPSILVGFDIVLEKRRGRRY